MRRNSFIPRLVLALSVAGGLVMASVVLLRVTGHFRPFKVPTNGMKPALQQDDQFFMEGVTYLLRKPRRHEILVFTTAGITRIPESDASDAPIYIQRLEGLPGDHLIIRNGELYVNDEKDPFYQERTFQVTGAMRYLEGFNPEVTVPADSYFVIGDNLPNSYDSRYWGFLPAKSVLGRAVFRYAPPSRIGFP